MISLYSRYYDTSIIADTIIADTSIIYLYIAGWLHWHSHEREPMLLVLPVAGSLKMAKKGGENHDTVCVCVYHNISK